MSRACRHLAAADLTAERLAHTLAVGDRMGELARARGNSPEMVDLYAAAGALHDIGYAYPDTGHHAIDGARFLHTRAMPDTLVNLVAHHSTARHEAAERGLVPELAAFPAPAAWPAAALWVADFTTSPTGARVTAAERVEEIRGRYAPDTHVVRALDAAKDDLIAAVMLVGRVGGHA
jgi:putative nucleotidyltransferase with HDIG domain